MHCTALEYSTLLSMGFTTSKAKASEGGGATVYLIAWYFYSLSVAQHARIMPKEMCTPNLR